MEIKKNTYTHNLKEINKIFGGRNEEKGRRYREKPLINCLMGLYKLLPEHGIEVTPKKKTNSESEGVMEGADRKIVKRHKEEENDY